VALSTRNMCNERDTVEVISGRRTDFWIHRMDLDGIPHWCLYL